MAQYKYLEIPPPIMDAGISYSELQEKTCDAISDTDICDYIDDCEKCIYCTRNLKQYTAWMKGE